MRRTQEGGNGNGGGGREERERMDDDCRPRTGQTTEIHLMVTETTERRRATLRDKEDSYIENEEAKGTANDVRPRP